MTAARTAAVCLLLACSVALSQPFPSFMLDSSIVRGPTFGSVGRNRVAFGPDVGLMTWVEGSTVVGSRVDRTGALLDTVPIDISGPFTVKTVLMRPGLAWGGGRFLVAWTKMDGCNRGCLAECAIIDPDGHVTRRGLQDSIYACQNTYAAVAFDGENFLVSWIVSDSQLSATALFSRVTPQGVMLDSPPRVLAPRASVPQAEIGLCFHDDRYMAVWSNYCIGHPDGVWASWVLPDGSVPDSVGFPIVSGVNVDYPSVTHDRHNYVVSWYEDPDRTKLARVTDAGQVLDTAGVLIDSFSRYENDVCSAGDTTLVVYLSDSTGSFDSLRAMAVRVDTGLHRIDSTPLALAWPVAPGTPAVALCGDSFLVAWAQPLPGQGNREMWYRRINREGQMLDSAPVLASYGANRQESPDVATDGTDFLAVWSDARRDSTGVVRAVYGRRFSPDGHALDPEAVRIGATTDGRPVVACGGGCYLVTWNRDSGVLAARVSAGGVLLDSVPFLVSGPDRLYTWSIPDIAFGDSAFLVVWQAAYPDRIHGVRVSPSGVILDSVPLLLQANTESGENPQVAFDGVNFLVVRDGIRGARLSTAGQLLDTADIDICEGGGQTLAFGGGVYLVNDNGHYDAWRVTPEGTVLDSTRHWCSDRSQVGFDGTDFMLLCERRGYDGVGAMRIAPDGRLLDSTQFLLVSENTGWVSVTDAAMATNGSYRVGVTFPSYQPGQWLAPRIRVATFPAVLGIISQPEPAQPAAFRVWPNPASRTASLSFALGRAGPVQVTAFDAAGRRRASLFSGRMNAGRQTILLDTRRLANGIYFLRLEAEAVTRSTRLVVTH
ncbi:MAG: T9SS type A sorting domain-containing protein [candidate division WOR-3 bacterium]|nr:T9SS type A sorting domain-containing protein [candidate division WOR-3 bacterium]